MRTFNFLLLTFPPATPLASVDGICLCDGCCMEFALIFVTPYKLLRFVSHRLLTSLNLGWLLWPWDIPRLKDALEVRRWPYCVQSFRPAARKRTGIKICQKFGDHFGSNQELKYCPFRNKAKAGVNCSPCLCEVSSGWQEWYLLRVSFSGPSFQCVSMCIWRLNQEAKIVAVISLESSSYIIKP